MLTFVRCRTTDGEFIRLVRELDAELRERNGEAQSAYDEYNKLADLETGMLALEDGVPVACGCFRSYDSENAAIKRMFVRPGCRRKNVAGRLLEQLENWAADLGYSRAILETGRWNENAVRLYQKSGYRRI